MFTFNHASISFYQSHKNGFCVCVSEEIWEFKQANTGKKTRFFFWFTKFTHEHWFKNCSIVARSWWDQIEIGFFCWKLKQIKKNEIYSAFSVIYVPLYDCDVTNFLLKILNILNTNEKKIEWIFDESVLSCLYWDSSTKKYSGTFCEFIKLWNSLLPSKNTKRFINLRKITVSIYIIDFLIWFWS